MTDNRGIFWKRNPGVYLQPDVCEPPQDQNANNARHAIWHLGREIEMRIFPTAQGWRAADDDPIDDGRHDRGEAITLTIRGTIQPYGGEAKSSSRLIEAPQGQYTHGSQVIHIDSHEPFNVKATANHLDYFPNGIRVLGPDTEGSDDRQNFSTIFFFRNRLWKVCDVAEFFEAGNEEQDEEGAIYRVVVEEFKDRNHERNATPETAGDGYWGPE